MTDFFEMFDPSQQQGTVYDLLPIGIYSAQIIEAETMVPKSGDGQSVKLVWQIMEEGEYENRQVYQNISFVHSNTQTQEIGRCHLKDLYEACGITTRIPGPEPLKFIPCKIRIGIEKDKNGVYDDRNKVTRIWPASYAPSASRARISKPAQATATSAPKAPSNPRPNPLKSSTARTSAVSVEGLRFTDQWQPPNSPPASSPASSSSQTSSSQTSSSSVLDDEVKAMIKALHKRNRLSPQEISEMLAEIGKKVPVNKIEALLVIWGEYKGDVTAHGGGGSNGGGAPSQASPAQASPAQASSQASSNGGTSQTPSQTSTQAPPQSPSQAPAQSSSQTHAPSHGGTPPWRD
jgi:hypothetical protein